MKFRCSSCSAKLSAREDHIGREVRCPRCSTTMIVADPNEPEELVDFIDEEEEDEQELIRPAVIRKRDAKQRCPMCGAMNSRTADECQSCGEEFSPAPSGSHVGGTRGVWRSGKILVMHKDSKLPNRCVKTNGSADYWLQRKLSWHHPALILTIFAGALIYIIIALIARKTATIHIGLSEAALQRRRMAMICGWLGGLSSLGIMGAGIASFSSAQPELFIGLFVGGIVFGLVSIVWAGNVVGCVSPKKIDKQYVWIRGVHPEFLDELPEWTGPA